MGQWGTEPGRAGADPGADARDVPMPPTYRLWVLDKHLAPSHLVLVWVHVDGAQQVLHALPLIPTPARPRLGGEDGIAAGTGAMSGGLAADPLRTTLWPLTVVRISGRGGGRRNQPCVRGCSPSAPGTRLGASPCGIGRDMLTVGWQHGSMALPISTALPGGAQVRAPEGCTCRGMCVPARRLFPSRESGGKVLLATRYLGSGAL